MRQEQRTPGSGAGANRYKSAIVGGIDRGVDKHGVVALRADSCYRLARREIPNTVAGMQFLAQLLGEWQTQSAGPLTIGIEEATAFGEALECYLSQAGFQVVVVSGAKVAGWAD